MIIQEFVKLHRFDGQNYTCWADKVKFILDVFKLVFALDIELPYISSWIYPKNGKGTRFESKL